MNQAETTALGLRFSRASARTLESIAHRLNERDLDRHHVELFDKAAEAAKRGEPLVVHCAHPAEATELADAFAQYGVKRPAVEQLSGVGG